jgi:hypothetical protein
MSHYYFLVETNVGRRWKSRQVWIRQSLSKISGFFPTRIMSFFIRAPWIIHPIKNNAYFEAENSSLVRFALSRSSVGRRTLTTYRIIDRSEQTPAVTAWICQDGASIASGLIPLAEDARVFQFDDSLFIYYQIAVRRSDGSLDCDIYVFDPKRSKTVKVVSPFSFNGKNWIPYQYQGILFFIYSISPLIVLQTSKWAEQELILDLVDSSEFETPEHLAWGDEIGVFGGVRGGSQLISVGDHEFLAFTHVTPTGILKFSHQAGALLFNAKDLTYKHIYLTSLKPGLLIDPFGIQIDDNLVRMSYSYSINNPHEKSSAVGSSIAEFELSEILENLKAPDN